MNLWSYAFPLKCFLSCFPLISAPLPGFSFPICLLSKVLWPAPTLQREETYKWPLNFLLLLLIHFILDGQREVLRVNPSYACTALILLHHFLTTFHWVPFLLRKISQPLLRLCAIWLPPTSWISFSLSYLVLLSLSRCSGFLFLFLSTHEALSLTLSLCKYYSCGLECSPPVSVTCCQVTNHPQT